MCAVPGCCHCGSGLLLLAQEFRELLMIPWEAPAETGTPDLEFFLFEKNKC